MGFLDCKFCKLHERHIESLQREIQNLEKLVFPPRPTQIITMEETEADQLLDGTDKNIPIDPEREAAMLMSANYNDIDNDLL